MKYEVIHFFTDLQDNNYPYNVGDIFPHNGLQVSNERLRELSGSDNKQHKPLIKAVEDEPIPLSENDNTFEEKEEEKQYTKSEISQMKKAELLEIARNTGVEGAEEMSRADLVEYLLNVFGL